MRAAVGHEFFVNGFVRAPLDVLGNAGRNENWSRVNEEERSRRTETEDSRGGDGNFANHANQSTTRGVTSIRRRTDARREVRHVDAIMTLIQHIDSGCMHLATKVSLPDGCNWASGERFLKRRNHDRRSLYMMRASPLPHSCGISYLVGFNQLLI